MSLLEQISESISFAEGMKLDRQIRKAHLVDSSFTKIRVAILSNATVDQLSVFVRLFLIKYGFDPDIWISEFDVIDQYLLDRNSELHRFRPDVVWFFTDERLLCKPDAVSSPDELVSRLKGLWAISTNELGALVIQNNLVRPVERVFGNFEPSVKGSQADAVLACNALLAGAAIGGVTILDLEFLSCLYGKLTWQDDRMWHIAKTPFDLDFCPPVARQVADIIASKRGLAKKVLVLDLDNTLWGGVIGDDGLGGIKVGYGADGEAYSTFQHYLLALKKRGVVLAVCSKNDEANARLPFEQHAEMVLRLDDISEFRANWDHKVGNIVKIAERLNLGLDSFVFVDDNPAERQLVRDNLPMVSVPELPVDPSLYVRCLDRHGYFETISFSEEDAQRSAKYRENSARIALQETAVDLGDYLRRLEMSAIVAGVNGDTIARASQLICKSNQFHLTTTRYSEAELSRLIAGPNNVCLYYRLKDRFGDNGIICIVVMRAEGTELVVDTWVMSCRVLGRSMEEFIFETILETARQQGCTTVRGIYLETKKNGMVKDLYRRLGGTLASSEDPTRLEFTFDVSSAAEPQHYITRVSTETHLELS